MTEPRKIWARGLNPRNRGSRVAVGDYQGALVDVEHFDGSSVLTLTIQIDVDHRDEVLVYDK